MRSLSEADAREQRKMFLHYTHQSYKTGERVAITPILAKLDSTEEYQQVDRWIVSMWPCHEYLTFYSEAEAKEHVDNKLVTESNAILF